MTDSSMHGIKGIEVCAFASNFEEPTSEGFPCAETGNDGVYTLPGLAPGIYDVEFFSPFGGSLNYVAQYFHDASSLEHATPVLVNPGVTTLSIDAMLSTGGQITGTVTSALTSAFVKGVEVCAGTVSLEIESFGCAKTGPAGEYTISGLATGEYRVRFATPDLNEPGYVAQYYSQATTSAASTSVHVTAGAAPTEHIDAALARGGEITGRVTSAATGTPLFDVLVCAAQGSNELAFGCGITDLTGEYFISGLAPGGYEIDFLGISGYASQAYGGGAQVNVVAGAVVSNIGAAMEPSAPIVKRPTAPSPVLPLPAYIPAPLVGPTPPGPASPLASVALVGASAAVQPNGTTQVKLDCHGSATCRGRVTLTAKSAVKVKGRTTSRTVPIGASGFSIPASRTGTIKIKLGSVGRLLLAGGHGRMSAHIAIVKLEPAPTQSQVKTVQLVQQRAHGR